jgi:hypothetical protein
MGMLFPGDSGVFFRELCHSLDYFKTIAEMENLLSKLLTGFRELVV